MSVEWQVSEQVSKSRRSCTSQAVPCSKRPSPRKRGVLHLQVVCDCEDGSVLSRCFGVGINDNMARTAAAHMVVRTTENQDAGLQLYSMKNRISFAEVAFTSMELVELLGHALQGSPA